MLSMLKVKCRASLRRLLIGSIVYVHQVLPSQQPSSYVQRQTAMMVIHDIDVCVDQMEYNQKLPRKAEYNIFYFAVFYIFTTFAANYNHYERNYRKKA